MWGRTDLVTTLFKLCSTSVEDNWLGINIAPQILVKMVFERISEMITTWEVEGIDTEMITTWEIEEIDTDMITTWEIEEIDTEMITTWEIEGIDTEMITTWEIEGTSLWDWFYTLT